MRTTAAALIVLAGSLGTGCATISAQHRGGAGGHNSQGIPPGHLPPPGMCRVWYADRPAGHQPPPVSCGEARATASRSRSARVIYGEMRDAERDRWERKHDEHGRDRGREERDGDDRDRDRERSRDARDRVKRDGVGDRGRAVPRHVPSDERARAFQHGYDDGYLQGRTDGRGTGRRSNVTTFSRYRSADRGYKAEYGSRERYRSVYRDGFRSGYEEGFRVSISLEGAHRSRR